MLVSPTPTPFVGLHALAGVGDRDPQAPAVLGGADGDGAALATRIDAVLDRVLHQRDQHHRREGAALEGVGDVDGELHARAHAHPVDLEEGARHVDLAAEVGARLRASAAAPRAGTGSGCPASWKPRCGSVSTRCCTLASVLKRKCGSTCACMSCSCASQHVLFELVALGLGLGDARRVARVLLAQDHGRHHHAAEADAQAHADGHAREPLGEHLAQVAALHEAREDGAQRTSPPRPPSPACASRGNALLANVAGDGEEQHAGVAHAQRASPAGRR